MPPRDMRYWHIVNGVRLPWRMCEWRMCGTDLACGAGCSKVEASEDGKSLVVFTPEKRLRVNLRDTYFASALQHPSRPGTDVVVLQCQDLLSVGYEGAVELCGILKSGRTQLRVRSAPLLPTRVVCDVRF
eukprot:2200903-Rhodomonas_salina.3